MKNKRLQVWLPLLFALTMIVGMWFGFQLSNSMGGTAKSMFSKTRKTPFQEILDLVNTRYVDTVNMTSITDSAIQDILNQLDPHSIYIPSTELADINDDLQGNFQGIGIEFNLLNDTLNVVNVLSDGPSEKAGLQVGDQIIQVEQTPVSGKHISNDSVRKLLKGPGGSKVNISILRNGKPQQVVISRGLIPLKSLDAAYMLDKSTGYIKLNKFAATTYAEFMESLEDLQAKGMHNLVLDLRDNGGGIMEEAIQIADEFLSGEKLIVYTQGKSMPRKNYTAQRPGLFEKGNLAVLINEGSASASEILSGALQDWDRATLIGRRSFGKGLVQEQYALVDGSALRLTVARYYTPLGRSIQKSYAKGVRAYEEDIYDRYHHGELVNADSNKVATGTVYITPSGKKVYGSGGIMPDVFIPFDTTTYSPIITRLYDKNTLADFAYHYYIQNKSDFQQYKTADAFAKNFSADQHLWNALTNYAQKDSLHLEFASLKDKQQILLRTKSLMARQIFRTEGFYEVYNQDDPTIKKALEIVNK